MKKKNIIIGIVIIILGILIAVGPFTLFKVCGHGMQMTEECKMEGDAGACACADSYSPCHWTAQAELGAGLLIVALGIAIFFLKSDEALFGISLSTLFAGLLTLAIPTVLIGVCDAEHMRCHALTRPALIILSVIVIGIAAGNIIYFKRRKNS